MVPSSVQCFLGTYRVHCNVIQLILKSIHHMYPLSRSSNSLGTKYFSIEGH
jgi:hypothetical protein